MTMFFPEELKVPTGKYRIQTYLKLDPSTKLKLTVARNLSYLEALKIVEDNGPNYFMKKETN